MWQHLIECVRVLIAGRPRPTAPVFEPLEVRVLLSAHTYTPQLYNEADTVMANPERGLRGEVMFNVADLNYGMYANDSLAELQGKINALKAQGGTVMQTYLYLFPYWDTDIPQSAKDNIDTLFSVYRQNGIKAFIRPAYDHNDDGVTSKYAYTATDIQRHMQQLSSVWADNQDVIYAFQMGWVGMWGEWHNDINQLESDPAAVQAISTTLFETIPDGMKTTYRLPAYKNLADLESVNPDYADRAGFHNDYFTLDYMPGWDYPWSNQDLFWQVANEGQSSIVDGEMPYSGDPNFPIIIDGFDVAARLWRHNYRTFSYAHNITNFTAWRGQTASYTDALQSMTTLENNYFTLESDGAAVDRTAYDVIRDHLGYRLQINQADYPDELSISGTNNIEVIIENVGMAAPTNARDAYLVLIDPSTNTIAAQSDAIDFDIEQMYTMNITPEQGQPYLKTIAGSIDASGLQEDKSYQVGLWLPDKSPSIMQDARYSIRLANEETSWFAPNNQYGINILGTIGEPLPSTVDVINVDIGPVGQDIYSGQGVVASPGSFWNDVSLATDGGQTWASVVSGPLSDSNGSPTDVTIEIGPVDTVVADWNNWGSNWGGSFGDLLEDSITVWGTDQVIIHGLDDSLTYDLYIYGGNWEHDASTFTVNGIEQTAVVASSWNPPLQEGEEYLVFQNVPTDGAGNISYTVSNGPSRNSGLQIVAVSELGITGDLDGDGFVGITDLNIVLGAWNQNVPPGNPFADPSDDGFVGIEDLNVVLGNWNAGTPPRAEVEDQIQESAGITPVDIRGSQEVTANQLQSSVAVEQLFPTAPVNIPLRTHRPHRPSPVMAVVLDMTGNNGRVERHLHPNVLVSMAAMERQKTFTGRYGSIDQGYVPWSLRGDSQIAPLGIWDHIISD
jgi:uncharacterized protein DUF4832/uncharacterized protein DUF4874